MADVVHKMMEEMVPELEELQRAKLFSEVCNTEKYYRDSLAHRQKSRQLSKREQITSIKCRGKEQRSTISLDTYSMR